VSSEVQDRTDLFCYRGGSPMVALFRDQRGHASQGGLLLGQPCHLGPRLGIRDGSGHQLGEVGETRSVSGGSGRPAEWTKMLPIPPLDDDRTADGARIPSTFGRARRRPGRSNRPHERAGRLSASLSPSCPPSLHRGCSLHPRPRSPPRHSHRPRTDHPARSAQAACRPPTTARTTRPGTASAISVATRAAAQPAHRQLTDGLATRVRNRGC
jgi:hypothetical protein